MKFVVSDQVISQLRELLSERIGYVLPPEFRAFVVRQLKTLLAELSLDSPEPLVERLTNERPESPLWLRFISRMTIGESYLFRNPSHMEVLQQVVLPHLLNRSKRQPVTLWSAGCSRGEEPYTLAILLNEIDPQAYDRPITIIATDIDTEALADARKATYGAWAFRQTPYFIQRKYFTKQRNDKLTLRAEVAKMVRFGQHHLAQPPPPDLFPNAGFDLIICRNVMMYFREDYRERAGKTLARWLSPQGVLITGQVEKVEGVDDLLERHFVYNTPVYSHLATKGPIELVNLLQGGRPSHFSDDGGSISKPITATSNNSFRVPNNTPPHAPSPPPRDLFPRPSHTPPPTSGSASASNASDASISSAIPSLTSATSPPPTIAQQPPPATPPSRRRGAVTARQAVVVPVAGRTRPRWSRSDGAHAGRARRCGRRERICAPRRAQGAVDGPNL